MYSIPSHVYIAESRQFNVKKPINIFSKKSEQAPASHNTVYDTADLTEQGPVEQFLNIPRTGWELAGVVEKGMLLKAPFTLQSTMPVYITVEHAAMRLVPLNTTLSNVSWQFITVQGQGVQLVPTSLLSQDAMTKHLITSTHIHGSQLTRDDVGKVLVQKGQNPLKVVVTDFEDTWLLSNKGLVKPEGIYEYSGWQVSNDTLDTLHKMRQLDHPLISLHPESEFWQNFRSLDQELVQLMMELSKPHSITFCEAESGTNLNMSGLDDYITNRLILPPNTKYTCDVSLVRRAHVDIGNTRHAKLQLTRYRKGVRISLGVRAYYHSFHSEHAYVLKIDFASIKSALDWIADLFYQNPELSVVVANRGEQYYAYNTDSALL